MEFENRGPLNCSIGFCNRVSCEGSIGFHNSVPFKCSIGFCNRVPCKGRIGFYNRVPFAGTLGPSIIGSPFRVV